MSVQVYKQEVERISLSDETLVFIEGEYDSPIFPSLPRVT